MFKKAFSILFFLLLSIVYNRSVKAEPIYFSHISIEDGLSQNTVFSIAQDNKGCMWFGTYDGVNKFDGYEFTIYRNNPRDCHSIADNIAKVVKSDKHGNIWVATREGLSFYNEEKDRFQNYRYKRNNVSVPIIDFVDFSDHELLVSTSQEMVLFDKKDTSFVYNQLPPVMRNLKVNVLARYEGVIYLGTDNGLYYFSVKDKELKKFTLDFKKTIIKCMLLQSPSRLWVGTEGSGLYLLNPKTGDVINYHHNSSDKQSISSNYIRSLALDAQGRLWIGTFNDLNIYHEGKNSFSSYTHDPLLSESLSQSSVRSIYRDIQGGMWLGTYFGGLNYYHPLRNRFSNLRYIPFKNSLNDNVVSCIVEDDNQNLWIGTNEHGLNFYNKSTGLFKKYDVRSTDKFNSNNVKSLYIDEKNELVYIGTHGGGLAVLHRKSGKITHYTSNQSSLEDNNVYAIAPATNGGLWLGTLTSLIYFNPQAKTFTTVRKSSLSGEKSEQYAMSLFMDSKNRLWVAGEKGVEVYATEGQNLRNVPLIPSEHELSTGFVNCVYESNNGIFWLGTRSGLYSYVETTGTIQHYNSSNGLPNDVLYAILEDSFGRIWVSTNKGLSCLNLSTSIFRNYTTRDGLQSNQFNMGAACRTSLGDMYFGGIMGITTFRPELLIDNPYTPEVYLTELRLFNKVVQPDDETGLLTTNINQTKEITFNAQQTNFSLSFVVSNYIARQHNTFAYKLEGYDKEWYYLREDRTVSYSNLPHGDYTFLVKAANNDGKWNAHPTKLLIHVLPIWYKTWWAISLIILASCSLIVFIIRYFLMRKTMETKLALEKVDKEHQEEINQMKMRFFINISHELRTPLTLIMAPLQEVMAKVSDKWTRNQLDYIQRNANRLLYLVNQLMDYRRAELGVFALKVCYLDIYKPVENIYRFYEKVASQRKITYTLHSDLEGKKVLFDQNYLELILNNLLSNAFKYTPEGKTIEVLLRLEDDFLVLQVKDTGVGIPVDKQSKIFERFFQVEKEHVGSGIGLSLVQRLVELHHGTIQLESVENVGSTFTIKFPQLESAYLPEELVFETNQMLKDVHTTNPKDMYVMNIGNIDKEELISNDNQEGKHGTLLIVEDSTEILRYLKEQLSDSFTVLCASDGEKALELVKENEHIDMILTDVMMPGMNGIQLCKSIKQNICTCHIPVCILSAKNEVKDQLEGLQVGADDYISKPFSMTVVRAKIQNRIRTKYRMQEKYSHSMEIQPEKITFNTLDEDLIKRAIAIVEKNIDNIEFSTDEFAREMNMSRSNLHLKLKAITGESAIDFIRKIRFKEACRLLKEGRYSVSEVSTMVGFNTPSYFATSFKKYLGCLPTEYVKKYKNQQ